MVNLRMLYDFRWYRFLLNLLSVFIVNNRIKIGDYGSTYLEVITVIVLVFLQLFLNLLNNFLLKFVMNQHPFLVSMRKPKEHHSYNILLSLLIQLILSIPGRTGLQYFLQRIPIHSCQWQLKEVVILIAILNEVVLYCRNSSVLHFGNICGSYII